MSLFSRAPKKLTPKIFARQIITLYLQVLKEEKKALRAFDRKSWLRKEQWDYDLKSHNEEHKSVYTFLSLYLGPQIFPDGTKEFKDEFYFRLQVHGVKIESGRLSEFLGAWQNALKTTSTENTRLSSNPIHQLAEKACMLRFGDDDEWHLNNLIMMTSSISGFISSLHMVKEAAKEYL